MKYKNNMPEKKYKRRFNDLKSNGNKTTTYKEKKVDTKPTGKVEKKDGKIRVTPPYRKAR